MIVWFLKGKTETVCPFLWKKDSGISALQQHLYSNCQTKMIDMNHKKR